MILASLLLLQAATACPTNDAALPAAFAHWGDAAAAKLTADGAPFETETRDPAAPAPVAGSPPARPGRVASVLFSVDKPGRYRLALDQKGWIDVRAIGGGAPLASVGHGHGPECSSIAKFVTFELQTGSYYLDLSGMAGDRVKVMLISGE